MILLRFSTLEKSSSIRAFIVDSLFATHFESATINAVSHMLIMCGREKQILYIAVGIFCSEFTTCAKEIISSVNENNIKAQQDFCVFGMQVVVTSLFLSSAMS